MIERVPCPTHSGHLMVPDHSRYCVNENGVIFDHKLNRVTPLYIRPPDKHSSRPYVKVRLVNDWGESKYIYRHRVILFTFKGPDPDPHRVCGNHINGIAGDDRLDNLEWTTHSENLQHSYDIGLRDHVLTPIDVMCVTDGSVKTYRSVPVCSKELNIPEATIRKRLLTTNDRSFNGYRFKVSSEEWLPENPDIDRARYAHNSIELIGYHICSDKLFIFESAAQAERLIGKGIDRKHITKHVTGEFLTPYYGYIFRKHTTGKIEFPVFTSEQKTLIKEQKETGVLQSGFIGYKDGQIVFCGDCLTAEKVFGKSRNNLIAFSKRGAVVNGVTLKSISPRGVIIHKGLSAADPLR